MYSKDFKQRYFLLCPLKKFEIKKHSDLLAQENREKYICISEIEKL